MDILDNLFRRESAKMTAVLTAIFGVRNLSVAEDVVQDAFCKAIQIWPYTGVPDNPSAWLMTAAKNKALDVLRHQQTVQRYATDLGRHLQRVRAESERLEEQFEPGAIQDSLLRMMFSCCHPRLPEAAQVALILHILCGFSVREVAGAFVSEHAAMEKRIQRAKKTLAAMNQFLDIRSREQVLSRMPAVLRALYLLFSEGYHGCSEESVIRAELCHEAMRLTSLLTEDPRFSSPAIDALLALMCFDAARLKARISPNGDLYAFLDQARSLWDRRLIERGYELLDRSAAGDTISEYHLEAAIAAVHCRAPTAEETNWAMILSLYDSLLVLRPSPVVALNRAVVVGMLYGAERGLEAIEQIQDVQRLAHYPFFFATRAELAARAQRPECARVDFSKAMTLARNGEERRFFEAKKLALKG